MAAHERRALALVGSVAVSTWLVTSDPEPAQPITAGAVMVFLTGFAVLAFALARAISLVWQQGQAGVLACPRRCRSDRTPDPRPESWMT